MNSNDKLIMADSTPQIEEYDIVIIGCGQAAMYIAWTMAGKGKKVVVIERKWVGGSCQNSACMPTKNIIHSAKVASYFFRSEEFGITKENTRISMEGVRNRKRKMVSMLWDLALGIFEKSGAEIVMGTAHINSDKTVGVALRDGGSRTFRAKDIIINTGSRALIDPLPGLIEAEPLTHIEALELGQIPDHLLIIGGGYVGIEFAQAMRRFGSKVTIIERNSRLLHREDQDISDELQKLCEDEGINVLSSVILKNVEGKSGEHVQITLNQNGSDITIAGSHLLFASGRISNTENMGLEAAGVEITPQGDVKVNERLQTTAAGIWAVGDCAGSPHFTHISYDDHRVVCDNLEGIDRVTTGRQVPSCMFTDPEFARIGLNETEAQRRGIPYRLAKIPMAFVLRTHPLSETRGFMKALVDPQNERILGFSAFGVDVGNIMPAVQVVMSAGLPYTVLRDAIIAHPTIAEGLIVLFKAGFSKG